MFQCSVSKSWWMITLTCFSTKVFFSMTLIHLLKFHLQIMIHAVSDTTVPPTVLTSTPFKLSYQAIPPTMPAYYSPMTTRFYGSITENAKTFLSVFEAHNYVAHVSWPTQVPCCFPLTTEGSSFDLVYIIGTFNIEFYLKLCMWKICHRVWSNAEEASFSHIKLNPWQALEVFHAALHDFGHHRKKPDSELMNRFVEGFQGQLVFIVQASRPKS